MEFNSIVDGNKTPSTLLTTLDEIRAHSNNVKTRNIIINGLFNNELLKVMECKSAKDVWKKLNIIYEGDKKIKHVKL